MSNLNPTNTLTVATDPGKANYTSVKLALDAANAIATITNRVEVHTGPGIFTEVAMTVGSYVTLMGEGDQATIIEPVVDTTALVTITGSGSVTSLRVQNVDGVGGVGIKTAGVGSISATIDSVVVLDCTTAFECDGTLSTGHAATLHRCNVIRSFVGGAGVDGFNVHDTVTLDMFSCSVIATSPANPFTGTAFIIDGPSTTATLRACQARSAVTGFSYDNGSASYTTSCNALFCTTGYMVRSTVGSTQAAFGSCISGAATTDFDAADANTTVLINSSNFQNEKTNFDPASTIVASFTSDQPGDEGQEILGELHVGSPEQPTESCFGEGDSYSNGMLVYTKTAGGTFTNVSDDAASPAGSTFTFTGTAVDHAIYASSDRQDISDYKLFGGIKNLQTIAAVLGAGDILAEYWNGGSWVEFNTMCTESDAPYTRLGEEKFTTVGTCQMRFNPLILPLWVKNDEPSTGTDRYWVRIRISSAITTAPVFQQWKLHSDRAEINKEGFIEFFGLGRQLGVLPLNSGTWQAANSSPANVDVYATTELAVGRIENNFVNNADDKQCFVAPLPSDMDTSSPISFRLHWTPSVAAGDVEWEVTYGFSKDGDAIEAGSAPGAPDVSELTTSVITTVTAADVQVSSKINLDVSTFSPAAAANPLLWMAVRRDATAGNLDDTMAGNAGMVQVTAHYLRWNNGAYIGQAF